MPPEFSKSKQYDGCQGTVWQMGILLVDMLSPVVPAFKVAQSRLNGLKSLAKLFNFVVFQSVSIFSILNHPCSFMLCYNLFGVFLSL